MKKKRTRLWTDEEFARLIKKEAITRGVPYEQLTRELKDDLRELFKKRKGRDVEFEYQL